MCTFSRPTFVFAIDLSCHIGRFTPKHFWAFQSRWPGWKWTFLIGTSPVIHSIHPSIRPHGLCNCPMAHLSRRLCSNYEHCCKELLPLGWSPASCCWFAGWRMHQKVNSMTNERRRTPSTLNSTRSIRRVIWMLACPYLLYRFWHYSLRRPILRATRIYGDVRKDWLGVYIPELFMCTIVGYNWFQFQFQTRSKLCTDRLM